MGYNLPLKRPLDWEEQIDRLIEHGLIIEDRSKAKEVLRNINYYIFTGYALQERVSPKDSNFKEGTSFNKIYQIYTFDRKLRSLLFEYLNILEIYFRSQISNIVATTYCKKSPHDQHYLKESYYRKTKFDQVMKNLNKEIIYNRDSLIVQHHKNKYDGRFPIWVLVDLMSFSTLSQYYSCLYYDVQTKIANNVAGFSPKRLANHLHCLSVLRNRCAHNARLYNFQFNPPAQLGRAFLRNNKNVKNNTLFAYIYVLVSLLPDNSLKHEIIERLEHGLEVFKSVLDLNLMGFPDNYKALLKTHIN